MENINQIPNFQPIQPVKPVKNQNIFKHLFIFSLIVIFGMIISFYFYFDKKISKVNEEKDIEVAVTQNTIQPTYGPTIKTSIDDAKKVLIDLQKYLGIGVSIPEDDIDPIGKWLVKNNPKILLNGFWISINTNEFFDGSIIDYFESNGFIKDSTNSYYCNFYQTLGYFKNDLKCLINSTDDTRADGTHARIFCGRPDQQQLLWRKELSSIIGDDDKISIKGSNVVSYIARINNLSGNYASGTNSVIDCGRSGGGGWLAVKTDGIWKIVENVLSGFSCKIIEQYQIPREFSYGECQ